MIGIYDYTVVLTYMSLASAGLGIVMSLSRGGHPYFGVCCLIFCGVFDAFDGRVARSKKNRTEMEKNFGIQIDSLSDLVAFGVLPACIGIGLAQSSVDLPGLDVYAMEGAAGILIRVLMDVVLIFYMLAAMIRLAYFNVTEEERQKKEGGVRKYYTGLPVTTSAMIFATLLLVLRLVGINGTIVYFILLAVTGFLFISKIQIRKPAMKEIVFMAAVGVIELAAFIALGGRK